MEEKIEVDMRVENSIGIVSFETASICNPESIAEFSKIITKFIGDNQLKKVVFDFGNVKFFSSNLLGTLLNMRAKLKSSNGKIVLSSINPQLHRVFKITNLDKIFEFYPSSIVAIERLCSK